MRRERVEERKSPDGAGGMKECVPATAELLLSVCLGWSCSHPVATLPSPRPFVPNSNGMPIDGEFNWHLLTSDSAGRDGPKASIRPRMLFSVLLISTLSQINSRPVLSSIGNSGCSIGESAKRAGYQ